MQKFMSTNEKTVFPSPSSIFAKIEKLGFGNFKEMLKKGEKEDPKPKKIVNTANFSTWSDSENNDDVKVPAKKPEPKTEKKADEPVVGTNSVSEIGNNDSEKRQSELGENTSKNENNTNFQDSDKKDLHDLQSKEEDIKEDPDAFEGKDDDEYEDDKDSSPMSNQHSDSKDAKKDKMDGEPDTWILEKLLQKQKVQSKSSRFSFAQQPQEYENEEYEDLCESI
jgi:hypothetical protein